MVGISNKRKIFLFNRKKTDKSIVKTSYMKFLNFFMRKGFKNRYINFFYDLLRLHKKKLKQICMWKYNSSKFNVINFTSKKVKIPTFSKLFRNVSRLITFKIELKYRKFRKKEILKPIPVAPWRGFRLGFNLLLKNSKTSLYNLDKPRKLHRLYYILIEFWDTFYGISETIKNVKDFTQKVLENSANFRFPRLFSVRPERRYVNSNLSTSLVEGGKEPILISFLKKKNSKRKSYLNVRKRLLRRLRKRDKYEKNYYNNMSSLLNHKKKKLLTEEQGNILIKFLENY